MFTFYIQAVVLLQDLVLHSMPNGKVLSLLCSDHVQAQTH